MVAGGFAVVIVRLCHGLRDEGFVTFSISAFGVYFGNRFGKRIDLKLDLIGGLILIGIGTKILIEHVFFS